jgi:hypothetical protein
MKLKKLLLAVGLVALTSSAFAELRFYNNVYDWGQAFDPEMRGELTSLTASSAPPANSLSPQIEARIRQLQTKDTLAVSSAEAINIASAMQRQSPGKTIFFIGGNGDIVQENAVLAADLLKEGYANSEEIANWSKLVYGTESAGLDLLANTTSALTVLSNKAKPQVLRIAVEKLKKDHPQTYLEFSNTLKGAEIGALISAPAGNGRFILKYLHVYPVSQQAVAGFDNVLAGKIREVVKESQQR